MKIVLPLIIVMITATVMTACGKRGDPEPLEKSPYPRTYPKPT